MYRDRPVPGIETPSASRRSSLLSAWRWPPADGSRRRRCRRRRSASSCFKPLRDLDHRTARARRGPGILRRASADQRCHPPARLHRGLPGQGGSGSLRDRGLALPRRRAHRAGPACSGRKPTSARPSCRPTASGSLLSDQWRQQAGLRQRRRLGGAGQGHGRRPARRSEDGRGQSWLHAHPRPDLGPDRPLAVHARARWSRPARPSALATIQRMDQVYVDITQSAADLLNLRAAMSGGDVTQPATGRARECNSSCPMATSTPIAGRAAVRRRHGGPHDRRGGRAGHLPQSERRPAARSLRSRPRDRRRATAGTVRAAGRRHAQRARPGDRPGARARQHRGPADRPDWIRRSATSGSSPTV